MNFNLIQSNRALSRYRNDFAVACYEIIDTINGEGVEISTCLSFDPRSIISRVLYFTLRFYATVTAHGDDICSPQKCRSVFCNYSRGPISPIGELLRELYIRPPIEITIDILL